MGSVDLIMINLQVLFTYLFIYLLINVIIFDYYFLVVVVPFSGLDMYGILHVVSRRDMIKATIKTLEHYLKLCNEQSKKHGVAASQVTVIFDMEGFNLRPFMWRPGKYLIFKNNNNK